MEGLAQIKGAIDIADTLNSILSYTIPAFIIVIIGKDVGYKEDKSTELFIK